MTSLLIEMKDVFERLATRVDLPEGPTQLFDQWADLMAVDDEIAGYLSTRLGHGRVPVDKVKAAYARLLRSREWMQHWPSRVQNLTRACELILASELGTSSRQSIKLSSVQRRLLDDAANAAGLPTVRDEDLVARFEEVMSMLGFYLVESGFRDDWSTNELGDQIEEFQDYLVRQRIERMAP